MCPSALGGKIIYTPKGVEVKEGKRHIVVVPSVRPRPAVVKRDPVCITFFKLRLFAWGKSRKILSVLTGRPF